MKIKLYNLFKYYWRYCISDYIYTQKEYDYIFKYLEFGKFNEICCYIKFNDHNTQQLFTYKYIDNIFIKIIHSKSPEGYEWLRNNFGKGYFRIVDNNYPDKQEFKTIVNRVINIELRRKI